MSAEQDVGTERDNSLTLECLDQSVALRLGRLVPMVTNITNMDAEEQLTNQYIYIWYICINWSAN